MSDLVKFWDKFREFQYADEILIVIGAMLLIVSILKIVKSSFKTFLWLLLSGVGLTGILQGLDGNPIVSAAVDYSPVGDYIGNGENISAGAKNISSDALSILCRKLEETELLQLE